MYEIVFTLFFQVGLTLGVGASTFALIFYVTSMRDGSIDAIERSFLGIVFLVLRIGMALILAALILGASLYGPTHIVAFGYVWSLLSIILANALLMEQHRMPMQIGPVLAGASWYSLLIVTIFPIASYSFTEMVIAYLGFVALCAMVFTYIRLHTRERRPIDSVVSRKDRKTREYAATDASIFRILPEKVFYPRSVADIVTIVNACREERKKGGAVSVSVRAGGTCMSGGSLTDGWIIDMTKHMNRVSIDPVAGTATVEAGAYFRDIEDAAAKHGLMFPAYPSSHRLCGIGGMIGNNASGEKSLRYGATSDNVLELEVVLADGTIQSVHPQHMHELTQPRETELLTLHAAYGKKLQRATGDVPKAASGYRLEKIYDSKTKIADLIPLFVGAQGTLGIVSKAVLKLAPIPQHTALVVVSAPTLEKLPLVLDAIFMHNPECVETFDTHTFARAKTHLSEHAERLVPYIDANAGLFILAQFSEGTEEDTVARAKMCAETLSAEGFHVAHIQNEVDVQSAWQVRRNSFTLMRDHNMPGFKAVPCIEDIIIPREALGVCIDELTAILKRRQVSYGFHGHIGEGSLRIIPVFDFRSETVADDIMGLMDEVFSVIKRLHGNISADHSDGIVRSPFIEEFYGEDLNRVFVRIEELYDPEGIMNPKKKVGGTREFLAASIDR